MQLVAAYAGTETFYCCMNVCDLQHSYQEGNWCEDGLFSCVFDGICVILHRADLCVVNGVNCAAQVGPCRNPGT
jgi:hypothetical protein